jgi:carbamoyl-phosphate synthase large subunit
MTRLKGKKVLILGSGGLRIGQAGEFDYSGSQAIKALKEEGIYTILMNPNIATIQTDTNMADAVYFEPLQCCFVEKIIEQNRPDALLLSFGGQTALNLGIELHDRKILKKYQVEVLGTSIDMIRIAEDRELFKKHLRSIAVCTPKSFIASSEKQALEYAEKIGYPLMMRTGFSLGGLGSGKISSPDMLIKKVRQTLAITSHVLIEEYLLGWKEIEYEVIRDSHDQTLTICNMENFDPMGIHTGDSIVVAPSQTLDNYEYHFLRDISIRIAKHFHVIGECNVQFALDPHSREYRVIEMNPRLSRSSALASKATGYPLAFVAAKLVLGHRLHEIPNAITEKTSCFFEPALDYITVKIPRWDIQKCKFAQKHIGSEMKSVGEVMAIGRTFPEALQKAIRMLGHNLSGLDGYRDRFANLEEELRNPTDQRLFALYAFFQKGYSIEEAHLLTHIDPWFLQHIQHIAEYANVLAKTTIDQKALRKAKLLGFSDLSLAHYHDCTEEEIRTLRKEYHILPFVKQIDTLAGECDVYTNYLYLTYHGQEHDVQKDPASFVILGSGPYCIGSSVEFDWCAVNMSRVLRKNHQKTILINSNPETVSTDFDESNRLYFEELTLERVRDICDFEKPQKIVVSVGGQIANNLAMQLDHYCYPLAGTNAKNIDQAENRERFSSLLHSLHVDQPAWEKVLDLRQAKAFANQVGYPVLLRPSYVLSGSAMNIVHNKESLIEYLQEATRISADYPVVISKFITDAKELEIDGVANQGRIVIQAITEHVENAGVHSGDATVVLPPQRLYLETVRRAKAIAKKVVRALDITGPFNIQFLAKDNSLQVIECNVRASRSFPFVSKVTSHNFIEITAEIFLNTYQPRTYETLSLDHVGVKSAQFSYQRLKGSNPVARVEMASTGEVACIRDNYESAFFASWLATEQQLLGKKIFLSISVSYKNKLLPLLQTLDHQGWEFIATEGTHDFLSQNGVASIVAYKIRDQHQPDIQSLIQKKQMDLIINIPTHGLHARSEGFMIRRLAIDYHIPLITNIKIADIFLKCLIDKTDIFSIRPWGTYIS